MWLRAARLTDHELVAFSIEHDLVLVCCYLTDACTLGSDLLLSSWQVRSAAASYGTIILGKIKIPAIQDEEGAGYIHVRCALSTPIYLN